MAPPLTYALLVTATLVLAPWVLAQARTSGARRVGFALVGSMLILEVGLILLYYSLPVCAALATVSIVVALAPLQHPGRWKITALFGAATAVAGVAFVLARQEATFLVYFGSALPFLFTAAFAVNIASLARWGLDRRIVLPAVGVLSFAALIPVSSFLLFFLEWFEVAHLPITLVALVSLRRLLQVASGPVEAARSASLGSRSVSDFLERPEVPLQHVRLVWIGAAVGALVTLWQIAANGVQPGTTLSLGLLGVGTASLFAGAHRNRPSWSLFRCVVGVFVLLGTVLVLTDVAQDARLGDPVEPWAGARLILGSLAALMVGVGLLSLFSRAGDEAARNDWADRAVAVAPVSDLPGIIAKEGGLYLEPATRFSKNEIDAATAKLERSGARFAVVRVDPPRPGWTVPDEVLTALAGRRMHVAVVEGTEAFLSPPLRFDGEAA